MTSPLHPLHRRRWLRPVAMFIAIGATLLLGAGTALAHVTVSPGSAAPGSYTTLSFRVPNESESASTTKIEIQIPAATPFPSVSAKVAPGWKIDTITSALPAPATQGNVTITQAVSSVTFTADGPGVAPHEFTTFELLVGPVPEVDSISFAAIQTYSDGEVVSWNEPTPASGAEPEHPAPVLTIAGAEVAGDDDDPAGGDTAAAVTVTAAATAEPAQSAKSDGLARVLGIAGILVGLVGIGVAVAARRSTGPASVAGSAALTGNKAPGARGDSQPRDGGGAG